MTEIVQPTLVDSGSMRPALGASYLTSTHLFTFHSLSMHSSQEYGQQYRHMQPSWGQAGCSSDGLKYPTHSMTYVYTPPAYHLCLDHVADCLVEGVHLVGLEVAYDGSDVVQNVFNERHHLQLLHLDKVSPTLLCNLNECVTCHVLYTVVGFYK